MTKVPTRIGGGSYVTGRRAEAPKCLPEPASCRVTYRWTTSPTLHIPYTLNKP